VQPQALDSGIDMYVVQCRAPTPHVTFISRSQTAGVAVPFALRRSDPLIPSRSATLFSIQTCGRDNSRLCDKACLCVFGPAGLSARLGTSIPPVVPPLPICGTSVPIASELMSSSARFAKRSALRSRVASCKFPHQQPAESLCDLQSDPIPVNTERQILVHLYSS